MNPVLAPVPVGAPIAGQQYATQAWLAFFQVLAQKPPMVSNPTLTTPVRVSNGDFWVEAAGTSPARTITGFVRDNGVSIAVFAVTY